MRDRTLLCIGETIRGTFLRRINRFLAEVRVDENLCSALVRNTGRLPELRPGTEVICAPRLGGKTSLVLLCLVSGGTTILIDPTIQSRAFEEAAAMNLLPWLDGWRISRREVRVGRSRVDYLVQSHSRTGYVESKSAARLAGACATFPDCPTDRGVKHIRLLGQLALRGRRCVILFIATHPEAECFRPDWYSDPRVAQGLLRAKAQGAEVRSIKLVLKGAVVRLLDPSLRVIIPERAGLEAH